ncbi:hypothetical protein FHS83_002610 [Rhizomicrobium palustre]|uniref:Uncharacterized protein n=1 Tax=Rhizomicrobium palustre TaxID=189966 RepID=A0A846N243_9PROT|nr:hypothetical protein [Rhizomicrobium palustre]NIK89292.1 hypothetical protein [Rhizomicrobium palustre]
MAESKVLKFPVHNTPTSGSEVRTADLFGACLHGRDKIAFIDIDEFSEDTFLRLLARNAVTAIIDIRPKPVFERPNFEHKRTVSYLYQRDINYVEYAILLLSQADPTNRSTDAYDELISAIQGHIRAGLTIFLFNKEAHEIGWVQQFRNYIRDSRISCTEIHPRSLSSN